MDALSHSRYWGSTAVFMTEDDPQDGSDHIDPHRSLAMVAGPGVREGVRSLVPYDQYSILRTIEMILGMPPMTEHDANARPMLSLFTAQPGSTAPYTTLTPTVPMPSAATLARVKALSEQYFRGDPTAVDDMANAWKMRQLEWLSTHGTMWHPPTKTQLASDRVSQARFDALAAAQAAGTDDCPRATDSGSGDKGAAGRGEHEIPWAQFGNPNAVLGRHAQ